MKKHSKSEYRDLKNKNNYEQKYESQGVRPMPKKRKWLPTVVSFSKLLGNGCLHMT